jgi:hypothetical protein
VVWLPLPGAGRVFPPFPGSFLRYKRTYPPHVILLSDLFPDILGRVESFSSNITPPKELYPCLEPPAASAPLLKPSRLWRDFGGL